MNFKALFLNGVLLLVYNIYCLPVFSTNCSYTCGNKNYNNQNSSYCNSTITNSNSCTGFRTQTQGGWGAPVNGNNPASYLQSNFATAFPNGVTIGSGGNWLVLNTFANVHNYLPGAGNIALLPNGTLINPTKTSYPNTFASQLVTLTINIGLDNAIPSFGSSSSLLKDLIIAQSPFFGWTVQDVLDEANKKIGGNSTSNISISDFNVIVSYINESYDNGSLQGGYVLLCPMYAQYTLTNVACNGYATGSIQINNIVGGVGPYTFLWSNGSTAQSISNIAAGNYYVTITDSKGVKVKINYTITQPTALVASVSYTAITNTGGTSTVSITASGGTAPYIGTGTFVKPAGTYTFTITDVSGCSVNQTIIITQPNNNKLKAMITTTPILCNGGTATITVTASGGTAPYSGIGSFAVTAGTYTYIVTDFNGLKDTVSGIIITQPYTLQAFATATPIDCNGSTTMIDVTATGGTQPYSGIGMFNKPAGTYNYTIVDDNGCIATTSISLSNPPVFTTSASYNSILCNGGNAIVTLSASGGLAPYSGAGSFLVPAGNYNFPITDALGCVSNQIVLINEPQAFIAYASVTNSILCNGGTATVNVVGTGGTLPYIGEGNFVTTAGASSYTLTDANGCMAVSSINVTEPLPLSIGTSYNLQNCNSTFFNVNIFANGGTPPYSGTGFFIETAGTYTYTVTDANGCSENTTITLTPPAPLTGFISASTILCSGDMAIVNITAVDGTPPYTGTGAFSLYAGSYSFTVSDNSGCNSNVSINIAAPSPIVTSITSTPILCYGDSTTITVTAQGGTAPYFGVGSFKTLGGNIWWPVTDANGCTSYSYIYVAEPAQLTASITYNPINCNSNLSQINVTAVGGVPPYTGTGVFTELPGTYYFTITDANGCSVYDSIKLLSPNALSINTTYALITCKGGSTNVSISASGGATPYTGIGNFVQSAGTYSYTVTDANGCSASESITLTEPSNALIITTYALPISCNDSITTVTVTATGGSSPYIGTGTFIKSAGTYNFIVSDANNCVSQSSITIMQPNPIVANITSTPITCFGNTSSINISASGGTAPYTGTGNFVVLAGTYNYVVSDINGCSTTSNITIAQPTELTQTITTTPILCHGGSAIVTVNATGGVAPYTGIGVFQLTAGNHTLVVSDVNGCEVSNTISIAQPDSLKITGFIKPANCTNACTGIDSIAVQGGTPPYTYSWMNSPLNKSAITICEGGIGIVKVTDASGCQKNYIFGPMNCTSTACPPLVTYTQGGWGTNANGNNPGKYRDQHFAAAFPSGLIIGSTKKLTLMTSANVKAFLPSGGTPRALTANYYNPTAKVYSNTFAGQLVAATLSVTFDRMDPNFAAANDLLENRYCNFAPFYGVKVSMVIAEANKAIGGQSSAYSISDLNKALTYINENYDNGTSNNNKLKCNTGSSKDGNEPILEQPTNNNLENVFVETNDLLIAPNPALNYFDVIFNANENGIANITVFDVAGRLLYKFDMEVSTGRNVHTIEINQSMASQAMILVQVNNNNLPRTSKVQILR